MKDDEFYKGVNDRAFTTLATATWAEATLQGLQEIWELPQGDYSWAAAGYSGAIGSGDTTCGLLIGTTIAIGLRHGQGKTSLPIDEADDRDKAIADVNEFYRDFMAEFGTAHCKQLISLDMSIPEEREQFREKEVYKDTCFKFFQFVMKRFIERDKQGL